jgi:hypothetical protein
MHATNETAMLPESTNINRTRLATVTRVVRAKPVNERRMQTRQDPPRQGSGRGV